MLSVSEAAALVVSIAEVMLNLGAAPGTPNKASSLLWAYLCVMLFGQLVVTDSIVGWLARTFKKRYKIDPALEWSRMKTRSQGFLVAVVICLSLYCCAFIPTFIRGRECYTAVMGEEADWSLTSCPPVPTNVTQMLKVGESWQDEWLAAKSNPN